MNVDAPSVIGVNGVRYELGRQLGRGGQGAVFEVKGGKLAAKLIFDRSPSRRERLRNQLTHVRRLPLQDMDLAKPLEMFRSPHLGYVMEMLTGMVPLKVLAFPPQGVASVARWYFGSGGLRRRLRLLARTADVLARLHGMGLVYSDPSPHNIFVSDAAEAHEVRLIDADNLHYQSSPAGPNVYTPGYGAPELVRGRSGVNTLTDAHAFGVTAFQTLALAHPLLGDAVTNGTPEKEAEALEGRVPWIDDPRNEANRSTAGIPRSFVLSRRLSETCERAFGVGLNDPLERPGIAEWSERLHAAADATLACSGCKGTYYFNAPSCPWCEAPLPPFVTAMFNLWDPSMGPGSELLEKPGRDRRKPVIAGIAVTAEGDPLVVASRLAFGKDGPSSASPCVKIGLKGQRLSIQALDGGQYLLTSPTGGRSVQVGNRPAEISLQAGQVAWRLHFGPPERLHRVVTFELRPGRPS